jgi:hypothetical protein
VPRKLRRTKPRPLRVKPRWEPGDEQRAELQRLLAAVDPASGEGDPRFVALLEAWEGCGAPWDAVPVVPSYKCRGGVWLVQDVDAVLAAIGVHVNGN